MTIYIVVKMGVYRHEIYGAYASLSAAKEAAEKMLRAEPDDYHSAEVVGCRLDQDAIPKCGPRYHYSDNFIELVVARCRRIDKWHWNPSSANARKVIDETRLEWDEPVPPSS